MIWKIFSPAGRSGNLLCLEGIRAFVFYEREKIYLFINQKVVESRGTVYRLEKCGSRKERILVKRAYEVLVEADRIIVADINPKKRKILIKEEKLNRILLKPPLSYNFMHEYEHVIKKDVEGEDIFKFSIVFSEKSEKKV